MQRYESCAYRRRRVGRWPVYGTLRNHRRHASCTPPTGWIAVLLLLVIVPPSPPGFLVQAWGTVQVKARDAECTADDANNNYCTSHRPSSSSKQNRQEQKASMPPAVQCHVYMAPSTLGADTNLGIYTGVALEARETVRFPEIAIPFLFREALSFRRRGDNQHIFQDGGLWERYVWEGETMELEPYNDTDRRDSRTVFVPGVGCTVNSLLDLNNVRSTHGSDFSTAGLHRSKDPGSGAFSPYHNATTVAIRSVPAGGELFASYGDYWIPKIPGAQVTLNAALDEADDFLSDKYYPFIRNNRNGLTMELKEALWNFTTKEFPIHSRSFTNLPRFPWNDVERELEKSDGTTSVVRELIRKQSIRSPEWLEEHGYCQDHLKPGRSTIPQAGFGAFASRRLPEGTVVGYAPLVHVGLHALDLWTVNVTNHDGSTRRQYDLILNYSFRHPNSTVTLTPYGGGVNYINHGGLERANVKVQWPKRELIAHSREFLARSPEELKNSIKRIGLSFEYVATREIREGEEVFLDYGRDWEKAWNTHVEKWKPEHDASRYIHRSNWNESFLRTASEQEQNPYPPNFHTMCIKSYKQSNTVANAFTWVKALRLTPFREYCTVLGRLDDPKSPLYVVELHLQGGNNIVVHNVPKEGVFLYDKAFSSDWHLQSAFRHEIGIPNALMPESWMNGPPRQRLRYRTYT